MQLLIAKTLRDVKNNTNLKALRTNHSSRLLPAAVFSRLWIFGKVVSQLTNLFPAAAA
jgi:hypothetical protein